MIAMEESGRCVAVARTGGARLGALPPAEARALRGELARGLVVAGFAQEDVATVLGTSVRTLQRDLEEEDPEMVDATMPPEVPPGFCAPVPRVPGTVEVTAKLMKQLRDEYGPGRYNDQGEVLGDLPAFRAWLTSLEERRHANR